jgi:hypothetical protein
MNKYILLLFSFVLFQACGQNPSSEKQKNTKQESVLNGSSFKIINLEGTTVETRFSPPTGYARTEIDSSSFANYLRKLPLKKAGSKVTYFDGTFKDNRNVYDAVVDMPIGKRDLHQCADAVMRLRAEYLFTQIKYDSSHFNFTNGFLADYTNWKNGKRISVSGNNVTWKTGASPSTSQKNFWKYLEMVFSYAGTASLEKELKAVAISDIKIGDVFIKGGFPGHAVIVVDMAIDETSNEKIFLLAQSYMPAQEIQILKNPNDLGLSSWYSTNIVNELRTPEWTFKKNSLKRF